MDQQLTPQTSGYIRIKSSYLSIILVILLTALLVGGLVYFWQKAAFLNKELQRQIQYTQELQAQIRELQAEVKDLRRQLVNTSYGNCAPGAQTRFKPELVGEVGKSIEKVSAINVLYCGPWDGPGGTSVVSCPPGQQYSYCLQNRNDGQGNSVLLGVVEE